VDAAQISGNTAIAGVGGSSTNASDPGYVAAGSGAALGNDIFMRELGSIVFNLGNDLTIATPIEGDQPAGSSSSGGLQKVGAGTLHLSGANTYSGITAVDEGVLDLNGSVKGSATVGAGGTFSGNATVAGNLTSSGVLVLGDATLGSLTLNDSSVLRVSTSTNVQVTGLATLAGTINPDDTIVAGDYPLLTAGSVTGAFNPAVTGGDSAFIYSVTQVDNTIHLVVTDAPIPNDGGVDVNGETNHVGRGCGCTPGDQRGSSHVPLAVIVSLLLFARSGTRKKT
jgi:autotransporter-associated beta strand protein